MAVRRGKSSEDPPSRQVPATTPEDREKQLIALAVDLVEKRMLAGTATSQEVTHFLKLGSTREQLEQSKMRRENELLAAKVEQLASQAKTDEMYREALNAMRAYGGQDPLPEDDRFDND